MWIEKEDKLQRDFEFENFKEAFAFLTKVAIAAEQAQHHPEIYNVYNKVAIKLSTHDAGNRITDKDRSLAKTIDNLA